MLTNGSGNELNKMHIGLDSDVTLTGLESVKSWRLDKTTAAEYFKRPKTTWLQVAGAISNNWRRWIKRNDRGIESDGQTDGTLFRLWQLTTYRKTNTPRKKLGCRKRVASNSWGCIEMTTAGFNVWPQNQRWRPLVSGMISICGAIAGRWLTGRYRII